MQETPLSLLGGHFPPPIFAGEQDVGPSEWRDVRQDDWRAIKPCFLSLRDGDPQLLGVPIDDDRGQQIQACDAEVLAFGGAVADFALSANAKRPFRPVRMNGTVRGHMHCGVPTGAYKVRTGCIQGTYRGDLVVSGHVRGDCFTSDKANLLDMEKRCKAGQFIHYIVAESAVVR